MNEISIFKMPPKQRKIAILGYHAVGKSSLSIQFVETQFTETYNPTIENTFTITTTLSDQEYVLRLVDTAGQDEYSILPTHYTMVNHGYVLVYSITSYRSFEIIQIIHEKLINMTGRIQIPIVLVGNKNDLDMHRAVTEEEGRKLAVLWKAAFLETSAKNNNCVADIFHTMLMEIEKVNGNIQEKSKCCIS